MKKILALAAIVALSFSVITATADEDPKKPTTKTSSCCASKTQAKAASCGDKAMVKSATCDDKEKAACASHASGKKENCDPAKCEGHAQKASTTTPADRPSNPKN